MVGGGQVVAHLEGRERDGGVEVLGVDADPVRDDLGRGQDFFECPGGKRAL